MVNLTSKSYLSANLLGFRGYSDKSRSFLHALVKFYIKIVSFHDKMYNIPEEEAKLVRKHGIDYQAAE